MFPINFWMHYYDCTMMCYTLGNRLLHGRRLLFTMLPKKLKAKQVTDFRPIANLRLLYKLLAYLVLGRLEHVLDAQQPEEQHGFRAGRRLEEHLLSANILLDKAQASGFPVSIICLELSKAFDRAHWPALWAALFEQGVSEHLIWVLQRVYVLWTTW